MKRVSIFLVISLSVLCYWGSLILAQNKRVSSGDAYSEKDISSPIPIVFGKKDDGLAEIIKAHGVIKEVNFTGVGCGLFFWSGTLRLHLTTKVEGYPYEDVFLVVPCFFDKGNEKKYLDKVVEFEVSKLYAEYKGYKKENPCSFEIIVNRIDSHGAPFYCTAQGQDGILKSIELQNRKGM